MPSHTRPASRRPKANIIRGNKRGRKMLWTAKTTGLMLLLFGSLISAAAAQSDGLAESGVLKVGLIPAEDARAVVRQSKAVMDQVGETLHMKTEVFVGSDYNATIEALRSNKIDVALMGAFGYVQRAIPRIIIR